MDTHPLVSVIIPAFNCANTISTAINSTLHQDYTNIEVIIIDDCSTDNTNEVINDISAGESRVLPLHLEHNSGPAAARNKGLANAHGELITFLDADDEWMPGKISRQVDLFLHHPDMDLLFTEVVNINHQTGIRNPYSTINKIFLRGLNLIPEKSDENLFRLDSQVKRELYTGNFICLSSVLVKKEYLDAVNGFDSNRFGTEDIDIWIRLSDRCQFFYLHEPTAQYNWLSSSISRINSNRLSELLRYHKAALISPDYSGLSDLAYRNIYLTYKTMIIGYANKWNVFRAFETFFASLAYPLQRNLWIYAFASFLGPIPLYLKTRVINPLFGKMKTKIG